MTKDSSDYIIRVKRAPEPSDVKWENCGASVFSKIFSRLFTWTITIILLGACFTLIYLINKWQVSIWILVYFDNKLSLVSMAWTKTTRWNKMNPWWKQSYFSFLFSHRFLLFSLTASSISQSDCCQSKYSPLILANRKCCK